VPFVEDVVTELCISSDKEAVDGTTGIIHLVCKCARCLVRIYLVSEIYWYSDESLTLAAAEYRPSYWRS